MWRLPPRREQNGILRYYFIVLVSEHGSTVTRNVSSNQQSVSISGLSPFTRYNYAVQTETVASGPTSDIATVYTPQDCKYAHKIYLFVLVAESNNRLVINCKNR